MRHLNCYIVLQVISIGVTAVIDFYEFVTNDELPWFFSILDVNYRVPWAPQGRYRFEATS